MANPFLRSHRFVIILVTWLYVLTIPGMGFATLNFAIICMVKDNDTGERTSSNRTSEGEFDWDIKTRSTLLAASSYGALSIVLFCGWLSDKLGAKLVMTFGSVVALISMVLVPIGTRKGGWAVLLVLRIFLGLGAAPSWPALGRVIAVWIPPHEKGTAMAIATTGITAGSFIINIVSGFLCRRLGWDYVFYLGSVAILVNLVLNVVFFAANPDESRWISKQERDYINQSRGVNTNTAASKPSKTPWIAIFTSLPVLAMFINGFGGRMVQAFILVYLPTYLNDALHIKQESDGVLSALPDIAQIVGRLSAGVVSDRLRFSRSSPTINAKVYNTFAFTGQLVMLIAILFIRPHQSYLVTIYVCIQFFLSGYFIAGYFQSAVRIAPPFAGTIMALCTIGAFLSNIVFPYIVEALVKLDDPLHTWRKVFYVMIGVFGIAMISFVLFGSLKVQPWAKLDTTDNGPTVSFIDKAPTDTKF